MSRITVGGLLAGLLLLAGAPVARAQSMTLLTPPPSHVPSGESLGMPLTVRLLSNAGAPRGGVLVSLDVVGPVGADLPRVVGQRLATTDSTGRATFTGLGVLGSAGTYTLRFTAPGAPAEEGRFALEAGVAWALRVQDRQDSVLVRDPRRADDEPAWARIATPALAVIGDPFRVAVTDEAGNAVSRPGIPVTAELASGSGELHGSTTVETDRRGIATFADLAIDGPKGDKTLRFTADALRSDVSPPIAIDYAEFDSHLTVGAIKTVSGERPRDEFFDISFVFPHDLGRTRFGLFTLATVDVALTPEQAALVDPNAPDSGETGADDGRISDLMEASVSMNVTSPVSTLGTRKLFAGIVARVFEGKPMAGVQVGGIELHSSSLHGSHLEGGYVHRMGTVPDSVVVDGETVVNPDATHNLFLSFVVRSDSAPFFSALSMRAMILLPLGPSSPAIQSRIVLSVPVADLFDISRGG